MPLQNRVTPWGEIVAVEARGVMMGNRGGRFHRDGKALGGRRWATRHWICCDLHYKGAHHEPMGSGYTSLFFLDEVTALAAGHRPCFYCRRAEARRFFALMPWPMRVDEADRIAHAERLASAGRPSRRPVLHRHPYFDRHPGESRDPSQPRKNSIKFDESLRGKLGPGFRWDDGLMDENALAQLPDGVMITIGGMAFAVSGDRFLPWSFAGYGTSIPRSAVGAAMLLTPRLYVGILAMGYQPRWHESASRG